MAAASAPSTAFAAALISELVRRGVGHLVVAPGSRSQALALVAAELERAGLVRLHVRIDERSAAFLALGIGLESGVPAAVITTSGSAVANLHPAILEAHHAGVPLLVITADRPAELHGIGANQTTRQTGIFGEALRVELDVPAPRGEPGETAAAAEVAARALGAALGDGDPLGRGPAQINLALAEPLSGPWSAAPGLVPAVAPAPGRPEEIAELDAAPRTAVIAGSGAGLAAEEAARALGAVLFAEVVSGAHFGPNLVVPYREVIRDLDFLESVERVIVFGHPTLSREVPWLIARDGIEVIGVRGPGAEDYNPGRVITRFVDGIRVSGPEASARTRDWVRPWVAASRAFLERGEDLAPDVALRPAEKARHELDAVRRPVTRRTLAEAVWRATWPHDLLVVGASRLVRELDRVAPGKAIRVHANRGLAGIDGTVSTAIGVALAQQQPREQPAPAEPVEATRRRAGVTRLLLGDLAFLHDVGGLALPAAEESPRIIVVVGNDAGGTIFDLLEAGEAARAAGPEASAAFARVMRTPQTASIALLAEAYGWEHRLVTTRGGLDPALSGCGGPTIVEVAIAD